MIRPSEYGASLIESQHLVPEEHIAQDGLTEDKAPGDISGVFVTKDREDTVTKHRFSITLILLISTGFLSIGAAMLALFAPEERWDHLDALVPMLISPFQTLLGAAIGWYFGAQGKDK